MVVTNKRARIVRDVRTLWYVAKDKDGDAKADSVPRLKYDLDAMKADGWQFLVRKVGEKQAIGASDIVIDSIFSKIKSDFKFAEGCGCVAVYEYDSDESESDDVDIDRWCETLENYILQAQKIGLSGKGLNGCIGSNLRLILNKAYDDKHQLELGRVAFETEDARFGKAMTWAAKTQGQAFKDYMAACSGGDAAGGRASLVKTWLEAGRPVAE